VWESEGELAQVAPSSAAIERRPRATGKRSPVHRSGQVPGLSRRWRFTVTDGAADTRQPQQARRFLPNGI